MTKSISSCSEIEIILMSILLGGFLIYFLREAVIISNIMTRRGLASAEILSKEKRDMRDESSNNKVLYKFYDNKGQVYEKKSGISKRLFKNLKIGDKISIIYDQKNPHHSCLEDGVKSDFYLTCIAAVIVALILIDEITGIFGLRYCISKG